MSDDVTLSVDIHRWSRWKGFVTFLGSLVMGLAAVVMLGWVVQVPWMVQIIPGLVAMVFSNALCLFLLGAVLVLTTVDRRGSRIAQTAIGIVVLVVGIVVLVQYRYDLALPLDLGFLHAWQQGNPGRMAPNTALAHVLSGLTVLLAAWARPVAMSIVALFGAFVVVMVGVTGLVGYRLHPELLYGWHVETRMALHTGAAFVLFGTGIGVSIYWTRHLNRLFRRREDLRVGYLAGALMMFVGLVGGIVSFTLMQEQLVSVLQNGLRTSFQSRHDLIVSEISAAIQTTHNFTSRPGVRRELIRLRANPADRTARQFVKESLDAFIASGVRGARMYDSRGRLVASAGEMLDAGLQLPLRNAGGAALLWSDEVAGLRLAQDVVADDRRVGRIELTFFLPGIRNMRQVMDVFGATGELMLCTQPGQTIRCLPTQLTPLRTEIQPSTPAGTVLMTRPLAGESGVGFGTDYRGKRVIAAYGPVGTLGLGMVLKVDADEIYGTMRRRFEMLLFMVGLTIAAGILLLRSRLIPLVRRLALSEQRYRSLLEASPDAMLVSEPGGNIVWANSQAEKLFQYTRTELIGQPVEILVPESARLRHAEHRASYAQTPHSRDMGRDIELRGRCKDGHEFPAEIRLSPQETGDGMRIISTVRDISERQRAIQALRDSEQRWQFALEGSRDGVWDWNLATNEVFFSRQWKAMLGYDEHEIGGSLEEWDKRVHPEDKARTYADIQKHLSGELPFYQNEHRVQCKDGRYKWILDRGMIVEHDADGKPLRMIGTHSDITERKQAEETIRELSLVDDLTGLRNRRGFFVLGESQLSLARRLDRNVVLYFADLDGLKAINDEYGHSEGDRALVDFATTLRKVFRETDVIARVGGDEFVVLALESADHAALTQARLMAQMEQSSRTGVRPYRLAASIGIAEHRPDSPETLTALLARADSVMYEIKQQRRARQSGS